MDHLPYQRLTTMTLYRLIVIHTQTLCELEVRAAQYGIDQPIALMHQRADTKMIIAQIEAEVVRRGHNPTIPLGETTQTWRPLVMAPRRPDTFVARPAEFNAVLATMLAGSSQKAVAITIALQGAGGFGKTTLAAALYHTPAVINAFPDGILWVTLGLSRKVCDPDLKSARTVSINSGTEKRLYDIRAHCGSPGLCP